MLVLQQLFNLSDDEVEFQVNDINHYIYKNSICIVAEYGFIRRFVVTPANTSTPLLPSSPRAPLIASPALGHKRH
jgi:IS5 family transposase